MTNPIQFFTDRFNLTFADIESLLAAALSQGGDYADLYFEHTVNGSLTLEEQIVKAANRTVEQGVGVRVISGERSGFAYCDEISVAAIRKAALTAAGYFADANVRRAHAAEGCNNEPGPPSSALRVDSDYRAPTQKKLIASPNELGFHP